jgi:hypothetical protein
MAGDCHLVHGKTGMAEELHSSGMALKDYCLYQLRRLNEQESRMLKMALIENRTH